MTKLIGGSESKVSLMSLVRLVQLGREADNSIEQGARSQNSGDSGQRAKGLGHRVDAGTKEWWNRALPVE